MNILSPGNGPSGIALSYMLSGNWPYYVGQSHDEFLHSRLMLEPHLSLVDQDLEFLSEVRIIFKALGRAAAEGFSKPIVQYCTPWKSDGKVPKIGATLNFWFSAQDRSF